MPIYEYDCEKCGVFEVSQRMADAPLKKCPTCKKKVSKLISSSSFQLKGEGWYMTEYGSKKGKSDDEPAPKPPKSEKTASETSTSKKDKPAKDKSAAA